MTRPYLLVFLLHLALNVGQSVDPPLPSLTTDYYSGFVEEIFVSGDYGPKESTSIFLTWIVYDGELEILREDSYNFADKMLGQGPVSRIEDRKIGVVYTISRHSHNCIVKSYDSNANRSADERFPVKPLYELLHLLLNYTYEGASVVRSALVDTWSSQHNLTNNGTTFEDALFRISFTRPGTPIKNINSYVEEPILWQFSISANESSGSFSSVLNFYEWYYNKPNSDVFDISVCINSEDYELLAMLIPGGISQVDEDHLHNSIRLAVANYTGIYPFQIGNIKIIAENGSAVFTSLQISNLTSEAQITKRISAHDAVQAIKSGLSAGRLPFSVELSPGVQVYPVLHEMSATIPCPSITSTSQVSPCTVSCLNHPCPTPSAVNTSTSLETLTVTITKDYSLSSCPTVLPTNTPQILTVIHTATRTIPCQTKPTATAPTTLPCITSYPPSGTSSPCTRGLSTGGAAGLAVGSFSAGIFCTFLSIILCVACCNCFNRQTMKTAGWKPLPRTSHNVSKEMDYFQ